MPVPCDCCPTGPPQCAVGEEAFASVLVSANPAGLPIVNLASTIDGTQGSDLSGFSPPVTEAQLTANPTTAFDYLFASPVNGLSRLRWHNGGGGVLTDQDGFGLVTVTFLDAGLSPIGASLPWDLTAPAADNSTVRELNFPAVNGVARVRFDGFHKQNVAVMGTGSPLLRQVEAFTFQTVFPCRRRSGVLEWYDQQGNLVPSDQVGPCEPLTPFAVPQLRMNGFFFGDDASGTAENLCNVVPAPSANTGWNAPSGGCYDPLPGNPSMTWTNASAVEMTFGDNGNGQPSGAVQVNFQYDGSNLVQWPTNGNQMLVGEQRWSNVFSGNRRARLTLVSANTTVTVNMLGGATIGVHWNQGGAVQIRYRVEFFTA